MNARVEVINERIEQAIQKLRTIRRLASKGGPLIAAHHHTELREILDSLRHHCDLVTVPLDDGKPLIDIL